MVVTLACLLTIVVLQIRLAEAERRCTVSSLRVLDFVCSIQTNSNTWFR